MSWPSIWWEGKSCHPGLCSSGASHPFFSVLLWYMWGISRAAISALFIGWKVLCSFKPSTADASLPLHSRPTILLETATYLGQKWCLSITITLKQLLQNTTKYFKKQQKIIQCLPPLPGPKLFLFGPLSHLFYLIPSRIKCSEGVLETRK